MPLQKGFWESLDVSIDDIIENETKLEDVRERLTIKLEDLFGDCNDIVREYYGVTGNSLKETICSLYSTSIDNFRELYALATYSENKSNSDFIYETAATTLKGPITKQITEKTINSRLLLLPLFKTKSDILYDIHYGHILQCKPMRKFESNNKLTTVLQFETINRKQIDSMLKEFEERSKSKVKRQIKLWRYKTDSNSALIVFRREKRLRSKVKKIDKNDFLKTSDEKIFIFRNGGNDLEVCSSKEKGIVKTAEFIIYKLTKQRIKYLEFVDQYPIDAVKEFIERLVSGKIENCSLLSLRAQNVALDNSPTIELLCEDNAVPALIDLQRNHGLSLLEKTEELLNLRIQLNGRSYLLRTSIDEKDVRFTLDNRNLREDQKHTLSEFLKSQLD